MSKNQAYVHFYASYYYNIHQLHDSDIYLLKIGIPDKNNLFATLVWSSCLWMTLGSQENGKIWNDYPEVAECYLWIQILQKYCSLWIQKLWKWNESLKDTKYAKIKDLRNWRLQKSIYILSKNLSKPDQTKLLKVSKNLESAKNQRQTKAWSWWIIIGTSVRRSSGRRSA